MKVYTEKKPVSKISEYYQIVDKIIKFFAPYFSSHEKENLIIVFSNKFLKDSVGKFYPKTPKNLQDILDNEEPLPTIVIDEKYTVFNLPHEIVHWLRYQNNLLDYELYRTSQNYKNIEETIANFGVLVFLSNIFPNNYYSLVERNQFGDIDAHKLFERYLQGDISEHEALRILSETNKDAELMILKYTIPREYNKRNVEYLRRKLSELLSELTSQNPQLYN